MYFPYFALVWIFCFGAEATGRLCCLPTALCAAGNSIQKVPGPSQSSHSCNGHVCACILLFDDLSHSHSVEGLGHCTKLAVRVLMTIECKVCGCVCVLNGRSTGSSS